MKKILLILVILLTVGCGIEDDEETKRIEKLINDPPKEEVKEEVYYDTNPIKVGLYKNNKLVHEYNKKFKNQTDIAIFNILFTNDENLGQGKMKTLWPKYYNKYEAIDDYKIGFEIKFTANGEEQENIMLNPKNQHKLHPYLYAYLYDDIHSSGHYSHITMDKVNDNTIYSSIKLYLHQKTNEITSPITLTVFTYKDDNDFIDGHYRGNSKYTITIYNK